MHFSKLAFYLSPLLASGAPLRAARDPTEAAEASAAPSSVPEIAAFAFDLSCPEDDEAFTFGLDAFADPAALGPLACGASQLHVAGEPISQAWQLTSPWDLTAAGTATISLDSNANLLPHSLDLSFSSICLAGRPSGIHAHRPTPEDSAIQVTTIRVDRIDGKPVKSAAAFNVYLDQPSGQILNVSPSSNVDLARLTELRAARSPVLDDKDRVAQVSERLSFLRARLNQTRAVIEEEKALLRSLGVEPEPEPEHEPHQEYRLCVAALYHKAKESLRFVADHLPSFGGKPDQDCKRGQTFLGSLMTGANPCAAQTSNQDHAAFQGHSIALATGTDLANVDGSSQKTQNATGRTTDLLLLPIAAVASLFCLSCVTIALSRACCSPRAKADWRARCEERRTRRQYRLLQRQHAWQQWWNKVLGRSTVSRSGDYDEKRALILAQENVLENAMQGELYRLQLSAGLTPEQIQALNAAERGQARSTVETLPSYRSRAGSGNPPSYRTTPSNTDSPPETPSISEGSEILSVSDVTPDSSIAALSPRHSSETLRTDRSLG